MKIGIEICDKMYHDKDFSRPEKGNPGIGGIGYQMLLLGYSLAECYEEKYEIIYFHYDRSNRYPENIGEIVCNDYEDALKRAYQSGVDYFISNCNKTDSWYTLLRKLDLKVLLRAGCYLDKREVDNVMKAKQIVRVIVVSSEEYDYYMDHDILERMICVENSMSYIGVEKRNASAVNSHCVTYIGSLVPQKGFLRLAKIWPKILKKIPDARLQVIGSGKLYGSDNKLGEYGIAEDKFEKMFMKYLTDEQGRIMPQVTFAGLIEGGGKNVLLKNTSVGIVNPIAKTECCCTSSIDFASCDIPVVTCGKYGLPSTVIDGKTGLTFQTDFGFYRKLVKLLTDAELNKKLGTGAGKFALYFDRYHMVKIWNERLTELQEGKPCPERRPNGNFFNNGKWLKVINAFLRKKCGLHFLPSALEWQQYILNSRHFVAGLVRHS